MKKTFLIFSYSRAQNTFPASGNVGIGELYPANKLQIGSFGSTGYGGNAIAICDGTNVVDMHYGANAYLVATGNLGIGGGKTSQISFFFQIPETLVLEPLHLNLF